MTYTTANFGGYSGALDFGTGGAVDEGSSPPPPGGYVDQQAADLAPPNPSQLMAQCYVPQPIGQLCWMPASVASTHTHHMRRVEASSPRTIVAFELSNGNRASILEAVDGDLIFTESAKMSEGENLVFSPDQDLTPLDFFLMLTTQTTPIPMPLIERYPAKYLDPRIRTREVVEKLSEPIHVDLNQLGIRVPTQSDHTSGSGSCGTNGAQFFKDTHCFQSDLAIHCPIDYCDHHYHPSGGNSVWYTLIRNSYSNGWRGRWNAYERTAACGTTAHVFHEYWAWWPFEGWGWVTKHSYQVPENEVHHSWVHGSSKRYRRVDRHRHGGTGGMRAYTIFTNNGNWC